MRAVVTELKRYLPGWKEYFQLADTPNSFREYDKWIRHRLRALQLKQWKRGPRVYARLVQLGLDTRCYDRMGVPKLAR
jgi:hypothetical protein